MYTQCPHCHTLFRVHPEHLAAAEGRVRCSRCDRIFNATDQLRATPDDENGGLHNLPDEQGGFESPLEADVERQSEEEKRPSAQPLTDGAETLEHDLGVPFAPDATPHPGVGLYAPATDAPQLPESTPPIPEKETSPDQHSRQTDEAPEPDPPFAPAAASPAIELDSGEPLSVEEITAGRSGKRRLGRLLWSLAAVVMLLLALAQLAWLERARLLEDPRSRTLLEKFCRLAECQLPVRRAPERFVVLSRSVASHPETENALLVKLDFSNQAGYAQPYPKLILSLYNSREELAARRLFTPQEYLGHPLDGDPMVPPNQRLQVEMTLADPGDRLTGFTFDFR